MQRKHSAVIALLTTASAAKLRFHLGKAMDNGPTSAEVTEIVSHFAC